MTHSDKEYEPIVDIYSTVDCPLHGRFLYGFYYTQKEAAITKAATWPGLRRHKGFYQTSNY